METYVVISECAVHDTGDDVLSGVLLHFGKALRVIDMSVNFGFWLQRFVGIVDNLLILFLDIQYLCISKDSGVGILAAAFREKYGLVKNDLVAVLFFVPFAGHYGCMAAVLVAVFII